MGSQLGLKIEIDEQQVEIHFVVHELVDNDHDLLNALSKRPLFIDGLDTLLSVFMARFTFF